MPAPSSPKRLTLCADDFGLDEGVDAGILALVQRGRLQAVSCLSMADGWTRHGAELATHAALTDLGLHLCLTQTPGLPDAPPLPRVIAGAVTGKTDQRAIEAALDQQWNAFLAVRGAPPDFIDGHQHVHQLPGIRDTLLAFLVKRGFSGWVRVLHPLLPAQGPAQWLKNTTLSVLGAQAWRRETHALGWDMPAAFGGIYDFDPRRDYPQLMRGWMAAAPDRTLLMCHPSDPAHAGQSHRDDAIQDARRVEFRYLASDAFHPDSMGAGVTWQRLRSAG